MFGCIYTDMCIAYNITSSDRSIQDWTLFTNTLAPPILCRNTHKS